MSLFGESPPPARQTKSSLFDDDSNQSASRNATSNSGLFAEADDGDNGQSPWDFPAPKKHNSTRQRGDVIKTLLSTSDVPESYVDLFDALLSQSGGQGGVTANQIKNLLAGSKIGQAEQTKILEIVGLSAGNDGRVLDRGEVNVVLALIGLAQEGEELGLDAVDERRKQLPVPSLPAVASAPKQEQRPPRTPTGPPPQADSGASQSQNLQTPGFGFGDDPWASPSMHKGHNHDSQPASYAQAASLSNGNVNGANSEPPHVRTTSNFTTTSTTENHDSSTAAASSFENSRPPTSESGWGGYAGSNDGFNAAPGNQGFGPSQGGDDSDPNNLRRPLGASRTSGTTGPEELVTVNVLEEKEGMFLFQHRNYEVASIRRNSRVIRRYSDFVWLLDCLHKKFPFRQLPLLPPKRVAIGGKHIAADNLFIEKRRRGLARFANALVRHPVLSQDQLVIMFLTVPTVDELAVWRKQASISVQEEFTGKPLPPGLEDALPQDLSTLFDTVRSGVRRSTEIYINMCGMVERLIKRNEGLASEYVRLSLALGSLTECSQDTYAIDTNEVELLNGGLNGTAKHLSTNQTLLEDEARAWDLGVLEDLKRQRDALVSMRDMFDRRDRYARDNIPQLERRIAANESKLAGIRARHESQIKPGEAEKVESAIVKDKQSIVDQHARGVFIKECVRDEIVHFQASQYHVSRLHQEWGQERVKYAELGAENWRSMSEELEAMPLGD